MGIYWVLFDSNWVWYDYGIIMYNIVCCFLNRYITKQLRK